MTSGQCSLKFTSQDCCEDTNGGESIVYTSLSFWEFPRGNSEGWLLPSCPTCVATWMQLVGYYMKQEAGLDGLIQHVCSYEEGQDNNNI